MTEALFDVPATAPEPVLPPLQGSEKQIRWATDIRTKRLAEMRQAVKENRLQLLRAEEKGVPLPAEAWHVHNIADRRLSHWETVDSAHRWIDARNRTARAMLGLAEELR